VATRREVGGCVVISVLLASSAAESQAQVKRREMPWPHLPGLAQQTPGQLGGQSMNPDISAIGELLLDFSPDHAKTTPGGERAEVREVELGIQAIVDPFFRADFFIGLHPEIVEIEEAYLTALQLPGGFQARLGRFHVPIGKVNLIHRPEQITVDYPWMIRQFFGDEGLPSNGVGFSRIFAPLGFFQELLVYGVSSIGAHEHGAEDADGHDHGEEEPTGEVIPAEDELRNQVALIVQLRNYLDLSAATNFELGFSAATGRIRELLPLGCGPLFQDACMPGELRPQQEIFENQNYFGAHLTVRWRPPQQGLYRSFIWNNEILLNDGHEGQRLGAFSQAQWQLTRRTYLGGRFDAVEQADRTSFAGQPIDGGWMLAGSGYFTVFPSEFSRFKAAVERTFGNGDPFGGDLRAVLQVTFAIGPHRPHAF
jgi:hypothetical protein